MEFEMTILTIKNVEAKVTASEYTLVGTENHIGENGTETLALYKIDATEKTWSIPRPPEGF